jgi:phage shock protein A
MRHLLKKIFGTPKPAPQVLSYTGMPAWLDQQDEAARNELASGILGPMADIRNAIARTQLLLATLAGAEHDPVMHPKLKTIAKNSLPQFVRAMKSATAKELPDDPEEFYTAAAECLKNCLQAIRGPGRYLQAIFPEETKSVRLAVDEMGRGINTINPLLGAYRKRNAEIRSARAIMDEIGSLREDYTSSEERAGRIRARITGFEERSAAIERELANLPKDSAMHEIEELKQSLADLVCQRDDAVRTYSSLSMTASHVIRKAEKLAARDHHSPEVSLLRTAIEILSDHDIPAPDLLDTRLAAACPVIVKMIESDQIALKNKEERAMFSDTPRFRSEIGAACTALRTLEERCQQAESALATHRITVSMQSLTREKAQLAVMLAREKEVLSDLTEWQTKTMEHIPALYADLRHRITALSQETLVLEEYGTLPAPAPVAGSDS